MKKEISSDDPTSRTIQYTKYLNICCELQDVEKAETAFGDFEKDPLAQPNIFSYNMMITMYANMIKEATKPEKKDEMKCKALDYYRAKCRGSSRDLPEEI